MADVGEAVEREARHKPLDARLADIGDEDLVVIRDTLEPVDDLPVLVDVLDDATGVGALVDPLHLSLQCSRLHRVAREQLVHDDIGVAAHRRGEVNVVLDTETKVPTLVHLVASARVALEQDEAVSHRIARDWRLAHVIATQRLVKAVRQSHTLVMEVLGHEHVGHDHCRRHQLVRRGRRRVRLHIGREASLRVHLEDHRRQVDVVLDDCRAILCDVLEVVERRARVRLSLQQRVHLVVGVAALDDDGAAVDLVGCDGVVHVQNRLDRDRAARLTHHKAQRVARSDGIKEVLRSLIGQVESLTALAHPLLLRLGQRGGGDVDDVDVDGAVGHVDGESIVKVLAGSRVNGEGLQRRLVHHTVACVAMRSRSHRQHRALLVMAIHLEKALAVLGRVCRVAERRVRLDLDAAVGRQPQEQTVADGRSEAVDVKTRGARGANVREVDKHTTLDVSAHHTHRRLRPPLVEHQEVTILPHAVVRNEREIVAGRRNILTITLHHQPRTVELDSAEHFGRRGDERLLGESQFGR